MLNSTMRFNEFKNINESASMRDEILRRLLKMQTSKRLQYGSRNFSAGGKNFGNIPNVSINDIFYDLGLRGIGYSAGTQYYKMIKPAAKAANDIISRTAAAANPQRPFKREEIAGFADALYNWYKFATERIAAGVNIHDMQQARQDAELLGQLATEGITEAPATKKPTAAQKKAANEKLRYATQGGKVGKSEAWKLKKALTGVINKYAKGTDWKLNNQYLDAGLYYIGDDLAEAERVGKEIIGALYGFFQDGARRSVTKLKREEDSQTMTFTAMPTPDAFGDKNPPQVSFVLHKNVRTDGPVIGIHIDAVS